MIHSRETLFNSNHLEASLLWPQILFVVTPKQILPRDQNLTLATASSLFSLMVIKQLFVCHCSQFVIQETFYISGILL